MKSFIWLESSLNEQHPNPWTCRRGSRITTTNMCKVYRALHLISTVNPGECRAVDMILSLRDREAESLAEPGSRKGSSRVQTRSWREENRTWKKPVSEWVRPFHSPGELLSSWTLSLFWFQALQLKTGKVLGPTAANTRSGGNAGLPDPSIA